MKTRLISTTLAAIAGVGLIGSIAACSQTVDTAEAGECANIADLQGEITDIPTVDCTEAHDAQFIGNFDMEDGDFPGDEGVQAAATEQCPGVFEDFVGISFAETTLPVEINFIGPSAETWDSANDRQVICLMYTTDGSTVTESWEDAAV